MKDDNIKIALEAADGRRRMTLTLDRVKVTSACTMHIYGTTSIPDHVTLASSHREIWPFECPVISTFCKV